MARTLVIGIGNPLRGDDGLGWHVIEKLREAPAHGMPELLACHQLTPELAAAVAQSDRVIFIDAAAGAPAGEVRLQHLGEPADKAQPGAFSHRLDPEILIQYTKTLYGRRPEAALISVKSAAYDLSEELSEAALGAVPRVLRLVAELSAVVSHPPAADGGTWLPA
jgi:hydrogenase maturation protease